MSLTATIGTTIFVTETIKTLRRENDTHTTSDKSNICLLFVYQLCARRNSLYLVSYVSHEVLLSRRFLQPS